jgi:hypothetical protein
LIIKTLILQPNFLLQASTTNAATKLKFYIKNIVLHNFKITTDIINKWDNLLEHCQYVYIFKYDSL